MKHLSIAVLTILSVILNILAAENGCVQNKIDESCENLPVKESCSGINFWKPQVILGYWNDNFFLQNLVNEILPDNRISGSDDFITASIWLRLLWEGRVHNWNLDCYYNILTNKDKDYRTDLLTFLLSFEQEFFTGNLKVGAGFVHKGNFGGRKIQNGYHALFNYPQIYLPYLEDRATELLLRFNFEKRVLILKQLNISAYLTDSYIKNIVPRHFESGFFARYEISRSEDKPLLSIELYAGYVNYCHRDRIMDNLFDSGFTSGILLSREIFKKSKVAIWMNKGQYGINKEPQFGILFSSVCNWNRSSCITDIKFP